MPKSPIDLAGARILISNDDGIHSHGIKVLEQLALSLSDDVWVCAPETEQSGASHSLTIHRPLRARQYGERKYAVDGTPTDCVMLAINHIFKDKRPDLVLSGINHGANMGDDVTYSGTIAAAMEATLLGLRAIALSQEIDETMPISFAVPEQRGADLVRRIAQAPWPDNVLVNVNFPAVPPARVSGIHVVRHGKRKIGDDLTERFDPRGRPYFWIGPLRTETEAPPDTDIAVIISGGIAVTPLCLDLTHWNSLPVLADALGVRAAGTTPRGRADPG
jgi:5'-nucleotidase